MLDISSSEFGSSKKHVSKEKYGGKFGKDADSNYLWLLEWKESNEQTEVVANENENENENKIEIENEDEPDKDPQYCMFLEKLTVTDNGKSYKLEVFQNDVTHFLKYEEDEESDGFDDSETCTQKASSRLHGEISIIKEVSRRKKINHKLMTQGSTADSCYLLLLNDHIPSDYGAFKYEGKLVKYEDKITSSESDLQILDSDEDFCEVNNNVSSLKEKLIRILEKPYTQSEYEEHIEFTKKKKPICRLLNLRGRPISSALKGVTKSLLDNSPGCFRRKLEAAKNEPQALNLLRMFRFWLEHVPNEDVFLPWLDKQLLGIVPSKVEMDVVNPPTFE